MYHGTYLFFVASGTRLYDREYILHNCLAQVPVRDGRRCETFDELCQNLPAGDDASILIDEMVNKNMEIMANIIAALGCKDTGQEGQVCRAFIFLIESRQLGEFLIHGEQKTLLRIHRDGRPRSKVASQPSFLSLLWCWTPNISYFFLLFVIRA